MHQPRLERPPPRRAPPMQVTGKPVAKVNGVVLTDRDLLREMYAIFPYARQHNGFPKAQEAAIRQGALEMIIFEELVYQEALRRKMTIPAAKIDQGEAAYRQQFEQPGAISAVHADGDARLAPATARADPALHADRPVAEAGSRQQVRRFRRPRSRPITTRMRRISRCPSRSPSRAFPSCLRALAPPEQVKEGRKQADEALKQAKATKSYQEFGLLAEKISEDDYRVNMGDHKVTPRDKLPPQVVKAFLAMKPGDVSGLIQIETAYTIIRLNAHSPAHKQSFTEVKARAADQPAEAEVRAVAVEPGQAVAGQGQDRSGVSPPYLLRRPASTGRSLGHLFVVPVLQIILPVTKRLASLRDSNYLPPYPALRLRLRAGLN